MASALTLHVHATCTVPKYLNLSMKARSRHTHQVVILIQEGIKGLGQLGTRPIAKDCTMG